MEVVPVSMKRKSSQSSKPKKKKSIVDKRSSDAMVYEEELSSLFHFEDTDILHNRGSKKGPQPKDPLSEGSKPVKPKTSLLIRYNGRVKYYWDGVVALAAFVNGFYIPYHIAFGVESTHPYFIIPRIFGALFGVDLLL